MAGHNKWSKIKRDKAITDGKRSQLFSKLSKAISVAASQGGGDPDANASLRTIIDKAKKERMPKDNIKRAVAKGTGEGTGASFVDVLYEGYGPSGVAFLIKTLTDNKNRTVASIRNIFSHNDGSLGTSGSTAYIFNPDPEKPSFEVTLTDISTAKRVIELHDLLEEDDDIQEVYSNFTISDEIADRL